jgi:predicted dehydrogenase
MRVGIVGCGLIGQKRAEALGDSRLVACADLDPGRAQQLAGRFPGCRPHTDWRDLVQSPEVDAVVVATTHDGLAEITLGAVAGGKHALVEKPAARGAAELEPVIAEAERQRVHVRVGFNHRYHRALQKARELFDQGVLGELMYMRARYGHGGRLGYEKEWRAHPHLSGGGELIDQGVHLIDLARWFLGDFAQVTGLARTYFWNMPVDDNAFLMLRTATDQVAWLHASATEWKNLFSMEIFGKGAKLQVDGLGGSYGVERLTLYRMLPQMGPPETTIWEYPMADDSWATEFHEFAEDVRLGRTPSPGLRDARAVLEIVEQVYKESGHSHHP